MAPAAALLLAWQVVAAAELDTGRPRACQLRYDAPSLPAQLVIERRRMPDGRVLTTMTVSAPGLRSARLETASQDSARLLLEEPAASGLGRFRASADLEADGGGGWWVRELAISGGVLSLRRDTGNTDHRLPAPLPRDVVGNYLNCVGDLVAERPAP